MALPVLDTSRYTTVIPSLGIEVDYRPYLVKEEKILMIAMESKDETQIVKAMLDVIETCIYDSEDLDINKFTTFDLEHLFIQLRSKSVGEKSDVMLSCNKCETSNKVAIDFDAIEVPEYDEDTHTIALTGEIGIVMRYPSVRDMLKKNPKKSLTELESTMETIIDCVVSIYDADNVHDAKDEPRKNVEGFIDSLNSEQFARITNFFQESPSLTYDVEFDCEKCKEPNELKLEGLQSFFT